MSKFFLGIDGGGTKTGFALADSDGNIVAKTIKTTIHAKQVPAEQIREIVEEAIDELVSESAIKKEDIAFTFAGVPGYGEYRDVMDAMEALFEDILQSKNFVLGNDCVAGWAGSQAAKPGVNMVLGTGAIAYGMDYIGNEARSSGWGPYCGDEGSGYWLGREAIRVFAKESDGRLERGRLYDLVKENYEMTSDFDFITHIANLEDNRTEIAKLSVLLTEAANEGDINAVKVIDEAAFEAYIAITAVVKNLDFKDDDVIYISYSGGVFNMGPILTNKIETMLNSDDRLTVIDSILDPSAGAALMALKYGGVEISDEIIEKMKG